MSGTNAAAAKRIYEARNRRDIEAAPAECDPGVKCILTWRRSAVNPYGATTESASTWCPCKRTGRAFLIRDGNVRKIEYFLHRADALQAGGLQE
jgi:hypothetical protein